MPRVTVYTQLSAHRRKLESEMLPLSGSSLYGQHWLPLPPSYSPASESEIHSFAYFSILLLQSHTGLLVFHTNKFLCYTFIELIEFLESSLFVLSST